MFSKEIKKQRAQELKEERSKRTVNQQLFILSKRPGKSFKETKRLEKLRELEK
jgi:hypothetical protein